MTYAKQVFVAVLGASWILGLWNQDSAATGLMYVGFSAAIAALVFGFSSRPALKLAPRRIDRRRAR